MLHEVLFVRYSGGALKPMEDAALAQLCAATELPDWSVRVLDNWTRNENLSVIWNELIGESRAIHVTLLNSDCFVAPGWDAPILAAMHAHPRIGAAGPCANQGPQAQLQPGNVSLPGALPSPGELARAARLCREQNAGIVKDVHPYGFCLTLRREAWLDAGKFNPEIPLYGNEDDLLRRMRARAWRTAVIGDSYAWHRGGASAAVAARAGRLDIEAARAAGRKALEQAGD